MDVEDGSASQLFGNKISDTMETLAKEQQLRSLLKVKEKGSRNVVKGKYNDFSDWEFS